MSEPEPDIDPLTAIAMLLIGFGVSAGIVAFMVSIWIDPQWSVPEKVGGSAMICVMVGLAILFLKWVRRP